MKRIFAGVCSIGALIAFSGCTPTLLYNKEVPAFKAAPDQALCVVYRPTAFAGAAFIPIYCDTNYVGGTEGNTVLSFAVTPGEHMIIADATNKSKVRFNFQAGKIYFIQHTVVTISGGYITINTSTFTPKAGAEAMAKLESEKGKITWVQPNPASSADNLSARDLAECIKDYDKWASEGKNAEDYKIEKEYPGY